MKVLPTVACLFTCTAFVSSLFVPRHNDLPQSRDAGAELIELSESEVIEQRNQELYAYLEKRRGGGGGGGKGGGSGGGSSGGSSSGSRGGSSSSSSSSSPSYGGGRYYGGGASTAYSSGSRSPLGVAPYFIGGAALGFFPGLWLYGAYAYPYTHQYYYTNSSAPRGQQNQSLPIQCLCQEYSACGCDDNGNSTYIQSLVGNGVDLNDTLVRTAVVNGTKTLVVNGTLPNGTDNSGDTSGGQRQTVLEGAGYWVMAAAVGMTVWAL
ncbi:hypothetical protein MMC13_005037 [Lambiella insularis]|nr:hypothetical protein [Lambiella insularis]